MRVSKNTRVSLLLDYAICHELIHVMTKRNSKSEISDSFMEACITALKKDGCRVTNARISVIRLLSRTKEPKTAREIFENVSKDKNLISLDQVSVYRTLEKLEELGLIHQVFPTGGYIACLHQHCSSTLHILTHCSQCEEIEEIDVPQESVRPILLFLKQSHGFVPDSHHFQLNGICSKCRS